MGGLRLVFAMTTLMVLAAISHVEASPLLDQIFRRDLNAVYTTHEKRETTCDVYVQCLYPDNRRQPLDAFNRFDFVTTMDELRTQCQNYTGASSCGEDPCPAWRTPSATMTDSVFSWACDHLNAFTSGTACWGDTFRAEMNACLRAHAPTFEAYPTEEVIAPSVQCSVDKMQTFPGCDADDVELVANYIRLQARVAREWLDTMNSLTPS